MDYFGCFSLDSTYFLLFESLGKTVQTIIDDNFEIGGLSVEIVKRIAKNMLSALKQLHEENWIHLDIKPGNIATKVSQQSLFYQLKAVIDSQRSLEPFRMSCKKGSEFDGPKRRRLLKRCLRDVKLSPEENDDEKLTFILKNFESVKVRTLSY